MVVDQLFSSQYVVFDTVIIMIMIKKIPAIRGRIRKIWELESNVGSALFVRLSCGFTTGVVSRSSKEEGVS